MRLRRDPLLLLAVDLVLVVLAGWGAFWLRFNFDVPPEYARLAVLSMPWSLAGYAAGLVASAWPHVRSAVRGQVEVGGQLLHLPRRPLPNPERSLDEHSGPARASNS